MSLTAHIDTLEQKHLLLEKMVDQESSRPSPDFMRINHLKKQKLIIKEEIHYLSEGSSASRLEATS